MDWLKKYKLIFEHFLKLKTDDKLLVVESWFELLKVIILLRTPLRRRFFEQNETNLKEVKPDLDLDHLITFLEKAAAHHIKHITCLECILALQSMVIRRGGYVKVNIGVKGHGKDFEAHAWLDEDLSETLKNEFSVLIPVNDDRR